MGHAKVVVTVAAVLMVVAMASAQTSRQAASTDTAAVEALTAEIRALRAELAESARTGLRLQSLTARIQAQEQRIIYLDRQRGEAATRNLEQ
jgi:Tfp pilus assembly protein PilO